MKIINVIYKKRQLEVKVDDDVYEDIKEIPWRVICAKRDKTENIYFRGRIKGKYIYMHRYILSEPNHMLVDHINHDNLDNRRTNLRVVTKRQNSMNKRMSVSRKLKYRGYSLNGKKFTVQIDDDGNRWYSYGHKTEEDAAKAYDKIANKLYGEYANLNFPK